MEKDSGVCGDDEQMELPPGFRFHPTDEELITHYLSHKVLNSSFFARAIGEVDLNKIEPWDLPWKAKMGEREWYFFCVRDRKYPTGMRTNRATEAGYWKATGKDKEIYREKALVGMKKTLVFYRGRAPKGQKTNWVMHEYRLEGKFPPNNLPRTAQNEWVISRVFQKSSGGKKTHISGLVRMSSELQNSNLPPLADYSAHDGGRTKTTAAAADTSHVTCFSDQPEYRNPGDDVVNSFNNPLLASSSSLPSTLLPKTSAHDSLFPTQFVHNIENLEYPDCSVMEDQSLLRFLIQNQGSSTIMNKCSKSEFSTETGMSTDMSSAVSNHEMGGEFFEDPSTCPVDIDCLWNY